MTEARTWKIGGSRFIFPTVVIGSLVFGTAAYVRYLTWWQPRYMVQVSLAHDLSVGCYNGGFVLNARDMIERSERSTGTPPYTRSHLLESLQEGDYIVRERATEGALDVWLVDINGTQVCGRVRIYATCRTKNIGK